MARTQEIEQKLDDLMFTAMRKHNFNQELSVKTYRKIARERGFKLSIRSAYRRFDKVSNKIDITSAFQTNVNQFFADLTKVASKATRKYMASEGDDTGYALDEYLRVANLQKDALNLQQSKSGSGDGLFMQFIQQNNNNEVNVGETLQSITEGLAGFGPLIERFAASKNISGAGTIPAIPAQSEARNPNRE